MALKSLYFC